MSYQDESETAGARPFQWIEPVYEKCALLHGRTNAAGTCPASGAPCFQGWETCQAPDAYTPQPFPLRFSVAAKDMPLDQGFIPFLDRVTARAGEVDPAESLGQRGQISIELRDAPHDDYGIDPYVDERIAAEPDYDPMQLGTFWPRFRARFPFHQSRIIHWYEGYLTEPFTLDTFKRRTHVIERMEGPGRNGSVTIVAKDPLKLADGDRAQWPRPSTGELVYAIEEEAEPSSIDVLATELTQYTSGTGARYAFIGKEGFTYTGTTGISGGVRLTGVSRTLPDGYQTERKAHREGARVQRGAYMSGRPIDIIRTLLVDGADVPAEFIAFADWESEHTRFTPAFVLRRMIAEPESVRDLLGEVIEQGMVWGLWWDEVAQLIRFRANRPIDTDEETALALTHSEHIVADTLEMKDEPDRQLNQINILYAQSNPTERKDEAANYIGPVLVRVDVDSQSLREAGQRRIKTIYARWHRAGDGALLRKIQRRLLTTRVRSPRRIEFEVHRKDDLKAGDVRELMTARLPDAFGNPRPFRVQILRAAHGKDTIRCVAREDFFSGRYGRIAPNHLKGVNRLAGTPAEQARYFAATDTDGRLSDGTRGLLTV